MGALLGLAVGDALGTTLEFTKRDAGQPLTDIVGGGPFALEPGQWTDDTSMALCLADSILNFPDQNEIDLKDLSQRFVRWYRQGENSVTGACFDIGMTTRRSLGHFEKTGHPLSPLTDAQYSGNGSIMRLAPVALRWWRTEALAVEAARAQSLTTHGAAQSVEASALMAHILVRAIRGETKAEIFNALHFETKNPAINKFIQGKTWVSKTRDQISSSGYVLHTLEAALWCVYHTDNFRDAVLLAANLGDDADTVAAVTGQIAGALYGISGIPESWLQKLAWRESLLTKASKLFALGAKQST